MAEDKTGGQGGGQGDGQTDGQADRVTVEYKPSADMESGTVEIVSPNGGPLMAPMPQRRNSRIPILFERAAKSWWNPKFDSNILEEMHKKISLPQTRKRFQYALCYIILSCIAWCIFFAVMQQTSYWIAFLSGSVVLVIITAVVLGFSYTKHYERYVVPTSVVISVVVCIFCLLYFIYPDKDMSAVGAFTGSIEILLMMYTVIPLPLYLCAGLGMAYSVTFELLSGFITDMNDLYFILARVCIHLCIHMIGIHIFIMAQVRKRSTFLKVGQSIMSHSDLKVEKSLKQQMIHSLMPPQVAQKVMESRGQDDPRNPEDQAQTDNNAMSTQLNFRQFHMDQMDQVSILFADIVGFTKMSSNKTAEHLVSLLNDLFGRFDVLCSNCGCEKISTLGDCYYAVSGCPTPREDHASCCVKMGLAMCKAIEEFDRDHKEEVDMRVGVHTGNVLCGLVGTRRFKFDVWSHDVTLANTMESSGRPGRVHISDQTCNFVKDEYELEPGEDVQDIRSRKALTECFDPDTQQYIIKHVEESNVIHTWYVKSKKDCTTADISPVEPATEVTSVDTGPAETTVQITVDADPSPGKEDVGNDLSEPKEDSVEKNTTNHLETSHTSQSLPLVDVVDVLLETNVNLNIHDKDFDLADADCDSLLPHPSPSNNNQKACYHDNSPHMLYDHLTRNHGDKGLIEDHGNIYNHSDEVSQLTTVTTRSDCEIDPELSTASLLGKRDNVTSSMEELDSDTKEGGVALREQLRFHEQSDNQLIKRINEDYRRAVQYLYKPPINQCTLQFTERRLESKYHRHYIEDKDVIRTLALPKFSALCDMIVSCIFFLLISVCCFLRFEAQTVWIAVFAIALLFEFLMLLPLICITCSMKSMGRLSKFFTSWCIRHIFGCIIASLPAVAVYANFRCQMSDMNTLFYGILLIASLLHYCNFNMLSSWMKSSLATVAGLVLLILWAVDMCSMDFMSSELTNVNMTETINTNSTLVGPLVNMKHEIILNIVLFLFLVWFLNREFEISYRLCFHGDQQAMTDRACIQKEKEQADWLLHNIIPEHVADVIKKTSKYCENHQDVGVVFASVTNFDNFYDESFEGGKEYLRVLNELMGDFEELFDNPKYKDIEKIKTIGSCLMAASGLNPHTRALNTDPDSHLYALMDFCMDLLDKLDQFNAELFNFDFKMKIGFNFGPVTSGVIGTTKLLYDIWGDTVNISSRMYSTGVEGKIQVTEDTAKKIENKFEFEYRGKIFVKGKGDMNTYLLVKKKPDATWE